MTSTPVPSDPSGDPSGALAGPSGNVSGAAPGSPLGGVDKALAALDALAPAGRGGLALAELATRLDVNKSTLHRTLAALRHRGYVDQDQDGRYLLGPAALALSAAYLRDENLPALVHDALRALCAEVDELVHLGVLAGDHVVYLDKVEPARPVRVWSAIGRHVPAASTALGRAMLAHRPGSHVRPDDAGSPVERALARGWAQEVEENEPGISCVAVPLLRAGHAVAAVSVTAPAERLDARRRAEVARTLVDVVAPRLPATLTLPPLHAPGGGPDAGAREVAL
ncbi:IclR family transcriptional regulator [Sediminihabitans luteus]|uniref:IclR family transcriptional regulator n=1 Tax=Sediminihabitans luteus TaxID=1138585 RepID=A0A2M9CZA8_9CELL|nr:IclR family transcriptional regulator [Sediminihabitans luteus]PJJ77068.1 IclR family transcriptional regulator [Sediminihabitans luteus]GIJ00413.1 transcriptional regulator [Sediminihabitans luteus]